MGCTQSANINLKEEEDRYFTDPPLPNRYLPADARHEKASVFSPTHSRAFTFEGTKWSTLIHCIYGQRFLNDKRVCEIFSEMDDVQYVIHLAHQSEEFRRLYSPVERDDWQVYKVTAMLNALRAKFIQNEDLASALLATGNDNLVYLCNDKFWGVDMVPDYALADSERGIMSKRGMLHAVDSHGRRLSGSAATLNGSPLDKTARGSGNNINNKAKRIQRQFKESAGANVHGLLLMHVRNELRQGRNLPVRLPNSMHDFNSEITPVEKIDPQKAYATGYNADKREKFLNYDETFTTRNANSYYSRQSKTIFSSINNDETFNGDPLVPKAARAHNTNTVPVCEKCNRVLTPLEVEQGRVVCRPCRQTIVERMSWMGKKKSVLACCKTDDIDDGLLLMPDKDEMRLDPTYL